MHGLFQFVDIKPQIISGKWVLEFVLRGYALDILNSPPPIPRNPQEWGNAASKPSFPADYSNRMSCSPENGPTLYSILCLVKKKSGISRAVLDLKHLNRFLKKSSFKMEMLVHNSDSLLSIDLKDENLHIPIHLSHCKLIHFSPLESNTSNIVHYHLATPQHPRYL